MNHQSCMCRPVSDRSHPACFIFFVRLRSSVIGCVKLIYMLDVCYDL